MSNSSSRRPDDDGNILDVARKAAGDRPRRSRKRLGIMIGIVILVVAAGLAVRLGVDSDSDTDHGGASSPNTTDPAPSSPGPTYSFGKYGFYDGYGSQIDWASVPEPFDDTELVDPACSNGDELEHYEGKLDFEADMYTGGCTIEIDGDTNGTILASIRIYESADAATIGFEYGIRDVVLSLDPEDVSGDWSQGEYVTLVDPKDDGYTATVNMRVQIDTLWITLKYTGHSDIPGSIDTAADDTVTAMEAAAEAIETTLRLPS